MVQNYPNGAIDAFSIAQIASSIILCFSYYGFFIWYISALNNRKQENSKEKTHIDKKTIFSDMEDFPFTSVYDFLPGNMENEVGEIWIIVVCYYSHIFLGMAG